MKKTTILVLLCFLIGLSLLLYPSVSNWWNSLHASSVIVEYNAAQEELSAEDYEALFAAADDYNRNISEIDLISLYMISHQHFFRTAECSIGNGSAADQTGKLCLPPLSVLGSDGGIGPSLSFCLGDEEMGRSQCGNLGQMGHA